MSKPSSLDYTSWMAKCCDVLEACSELEQDHILVWLVRIQYIQHELWQLHRARRRADFAQNEQHLQLLRIGLETQLRDFQARIPGHLSTTPSILMASLNADAYVLAAPLMQAPRPRLEDSADPLADAARFQAATYTVRAVFDYVASLAPARLGLLSGPDLTRLIVLVILAYRLSFPMPACPGYDYAAGRRVLDFGTHLARLSALDGKEGGGGSDGDRTGGKAKGETAAAAAKKVDVVTAMRVVLGSVRARFDRKSAELEAAAAAEEGGAGRRARMCPMFDGSLDQYLPLWEGQQDDGSFVGSSASASYATPSHSGSSSAPTAADSVLSAAVAAAGTVDAALYPPLVDGAPAKPVFHDLWATMTMGWADDADVGVGVHPGIVNGAGVGDVGGFGDLVGL